LGLPVLIPDTYVADLQVRLKLYRQISELQDISEIEPLRAELLDRFGPYPVEVENLLDTIALKILAKRANIERLEAGSKGATISFYKNTVPNPAGLIEYITSQLGTIKIRPDQKVVVMRPWDKTSDRLNGVKKIIEKFAEIAAKG
jgi:transcription-repair coupling factor (superfamily II helicase)